tara:strand:- start:1534 stop:1953 length:420 start_codon:yes stop_codon:yes gene_type:complete
MRIWSIHPQYLEPKGIVALWRETLLAQKVLKGQTNGYRNHPQLNRFKACPSPLGAIADYLREIFADAVRRGYSFNHSKIETVSLGKQLPVTMGQIAFERLHLAAKLNRRAPEQVPPPDPPLPHPLFKIEPGALENWERP